MLIDWVVCWIKIDTPLISCWYELFISLIIWFIFCKSGPKFFSNFWEFELLVIIPFNFESIFSNDLLKISFELFNFDSNVLNASSFFFFSSSNCSYKGFNLSSIIFEKVSTNKSTLIKGIFEFDSISFFSFE